MKQWPFLFLCFYWFLLTACEKEEPLPKATNNGAEIMAAKINGNRWVKTACFGCIGGSSGLSANYNPVRISGITGEERKGNNKIYIEINFYDITSPGTYIIGLRDDLSRREQFAGVFISHENKHYTTTSQSKGKLVITRLDTAAKIMSGTFEFTAEDEKDPASTIRVTDGRFDVKFR